MSALSSVWFPGGRGPCSCQASTLSEHHTPFKKRSEPDSVDYQRTGATYRGTCAEVYGTRVTLFPCSTVFWLIFMASALRERAPTPHSVSPARPRNGTGPLGALRQPLSLCRQAPAPPNPPHSNLPASPLLSPSRGRALSVPNSGPRRPNSGRGSVLTGATERLMAQGVAEIPCSDTPRA